MGWEKKEIREWTEEDKAEFISEVKRYRQRARRDALLSVLFFSLAEFATWTIHPLVGLIITIPGVILLLRFAKRKSPEVILWEKYKLKRRAEK